MTRYTMPARSQGELYAQRAAAHLERDTHRWVFVHNLTPEVECDVREWLFQRLNNTPPLPSLARNDEAVEVNARGLTALEAAKALIKATGLNLHMSVYGWPFCLGDLDTAEGGAA